MLRKASGVTPAKTQKSRRHAVRVRRLIQCDPYEVEASILANKESETEEEKKYVHIHLKKNKTKKTKHNYQLKTIHPIKLNPIKENTKNHSEKNKTKQKPIKGQVGRGRVNKKIIISKSYIGLFCYYLPSIVGLKG